MAFVAHDQYGQKYKIEADAYKIAQFRMPDIRQQGAKLMVSILTDDAVKLYIITSENLLSSEYYIALFHRGIGINYIKIEGKNLSRSISIATDHLGVGINRLVLLNAHFEPLSERLVFINKTYEDYHINIDLKKKELQTRQQVKMK